MISNARTPLRRGLAIGCALALFAGAAAHSAASPQKHVVTMDHMRYGPVPADVHVGDTIVWVNRDTVPHTVTARDKSFNLRIGPGERASMVAEKAGSFPFYCIYHLQMRGTLKVSD